MNIPLKGNWLDMIKGSVATLGLFLAYVTLPLAGLLPGIFVPLPAIFYSLKNGRGSSAVIVAITVAVLAVLTGIPTAVLYLLQCGVISLALAMFLAADKSGARAITYAVAVNVAVLLLFAAGYGLLNGTDLHQQVLKGIDTSISQSLVLYEKSGIKGDDLKTMEQILRQGGGFIGRIYPALLLIGLAVIAGFNLLAVRRLSRKLSSPPAIGDLKGFRNPDLLVWFLIVAGFAMLIPSPLVNDAALNLLIVVLALYFMQGLAVISCFFDRFAVPVGLRWFFYIFMAVQPYLTVAVAVLGIFDLWGDFRTPKQRENL